MAEWSSFFNSYQGDRRYTAAEFVEYFASFIGNGVFWGGNELKVNSKSLMDITVNTGKAWINGYYYVNRDAVKTLTLEPAHLTLSRIDKVVLRLDLSQPVRRIHATVKKGANADNPTAPALQRDNAIYELGLADIRINPNVSTIQQSNITDLRLNASYCGVVAGLVNQPDLTSIFNQYQSKFNEVSTGWDSWFAGTKGNWNTSLSNWNAAFADVKALFEGWFAQIKAELFSQVSTDFEDWSRHGGYTMKTNFLSSGNIEETLQNKLNNSVLATRVTEFLADGRIKITLTYSEPRLKTSKIISFGSNLITEDITEVMSW